MSSDYQMNNNYNVVVPKKPGYPRQQQVDEILNRIDNCPSCRDIEELVALGTEEAEAYIRGKFEDLQKEMRAYFKEIFERLEDQLKPLEPLVKPPKDIQEVIEYCKALVEYFSGPYKQMIEMVKFYTDFSAAVSRAITSKAMDYGCLTDVTVLLPTMPNINLPALPDADDVIDNIPDTEV
jgi:hypothetical protein